jgi:hypothetical protein
MSQERATRSGMSKAKVGHCHLRSAKRTTAVGLGSAVSLRCNAGEMGTNIDLVEPWVPFNEIYRGWLKQRKERRMRVSSTNTPAAPIEDDVIVYRPPKRQKVEHTTEAGPSRSSATLGQASGSKYVNTYSRWRRC